MSRKRNVNTYALVYWTESNEISVLDSRCVIDEDMLKDPNRIGMVEFGEPSITAPPGGWPMFLGKVLAVSENEDELRKLEDDFIENGNLKFDQNNTNKNKRKKTKVLNEILPTKSETRTRRNSSMDKQQLIDRINYLEEELEAEKKKNEQLLRLNWQLQEDLPKIIEKAVKAVDKNKEREVSASSSQNLEENTTIKVVLDKVESLATPSSSTKSTTSSTKTEVETK